MSHSLYTSADENGTIIQKGTIMSYKSWNADEYARFSKGQEKWAKELIKKLSLNGKESILDLGCGDGKITYQLSQLTDGHVTGIDKSRSMIALAQERFPSVDFRVMDVRSMVFDRRYDVIFSNAALHWVRDHTSVLEGIRNALAPGGKILLQFGGYGNAGAVMRLMDTFIEAEGYQRYFQDFVFPYYFPRPDAYTKLLHNAGLDGIHATAIPKKMVHEDRESFRGWFRTTWFPYIDRIPEERQNHFIESFVDYCMERLEVDDQGKVTIDMVRLEVEGRLI